MNSKEAKDFIVAQAVEQSALDKVPLSDIEKRMMYFVENDSGSCDEDPLELNAEFEAQCDTPAYEAKVSRILHHAYDRLKKENPEGATKWKEAIRLLSSGDHYLPVLWGAEFPSDHPTRDALKLIAIGLICGLILAVVIFLFS